MSDAVIYFSQGTCSIAVLAALEQAELAYSAINVPMADHGAGDEAFGLLNPRRQVPVLVLDGRPVREIPAIFAVLDQKAPKAELLPKNADKRIEAIEWLGHFASTIHPAFRPLFRPRRYLGADMTATAALRATTLARVTELLAQVERDLRGRDWVLGDPTAVDFYLFVFSRWVRLLSAELSTALDAHHTRVADLLSMKRALARETAGELASA